MLTDKLKLALACAVALLLLAMLIPLGIHNIVLQSQLTQANSDLTTKGTELTIKQMELTGLATAIGEQNDRITDFERKGEAMLAARANAQQTAAVRIQELSAVIARLEREKRAGCTASGMREKILREVNL